MEVRQYLNSFWIPRNLELDRLLVEHDLTEWCKPEHFRKLYLLISLIQHAYLDFDKRGLKRNSFVPIASKTLKEVIGEHRINGKCFYRIVISVLMKIGVIEENRKYRAAMDGKNGFPKSFRFTKAYWNQPAERIQLRTPKPHKEKDRSVIKNEVQEFIHSNLKRLCLSDKILHEVLVHASDERRRQIWLHEEKFREGAINLSGGKNQRRIAHCLTKCPREMRRAFVLNGRSLCEYDTPSCQPTLLLHFSNQIPAAEDLDYRAVLSGDFYTALGPPNRDKGKNQFLKFAFGQYQRENILGRNFTQRFPELTKIIRSFPPKESGKQTLSCLLQDLEAEICIYAVVRNCMEHGLFVVPVHDSFIVEPSSVQFVQNAVRAEFSRRFGFSMQLKRKWEQEPKEFTTWADFSEENGLAA